MKKKRLLIAILIVIIAGTAGIIHIGNLQKNEETDSKLKELRNLLEKIDNESATKEYTKTPMTLRAFSQEVEPSFELIDQNTILYRVVEEEQIGEKIGTIKVKDKSGNIIESDVYKIINISSKCAKAVKDKKNNVFFLLINEEYRPNTLKTFVEDFDLKNTEIEINCGNNIFSTHDNYLWNTLFNKDTGEVAYDFGSNKLVVDIYINQKNINEIFKIDFSEKDGNGWMLITSAYGLFSFEVDFGELNDLMDYAYENYEMYKYERETIKPIFGNTQDFLEE